MGPVLSKLPDQVCDFDGATKEIFDRVDRQGNGTIELEELQPLCDELERYLMHAIEQAYPNRCARVGRYLGEWVHGLVCLECDAPPLPHPLQYPFVDGVTSTYSRKHT